MLGARHIGCFRSGMAGRQQRAHEEYARQEQRTQALFFNSHFSNQLDLLGRMSFAAAALRLVGAMNDIMALAVRLTLIWIKWYVTAILVSSLGKALDGDWRARGQETVLDVIRRMETKPDRP